MNNKIIIFFNLIKINMTLIIIYGVNNDLESIKERNLIEISRIPILISE